MKKLTTILAICVFASTQLLSQSFYNSKQIGGLLEDYVRDIVLSPSGASYVSIAFSGTANIGGQTVVSNGNSMDIAIAKFDASGQLVWLQTFGSSATDRPFQINLDGSGNVYMTGEYSGAMLVGSVPVAHIGGTDIFVVKYDTNGNFAWVKNWGSDNNDRGRSIVPNSAGSSIYIAGNFRDDISFGSSFLSSIGDRDGYIARLNGSGTTVWAKRVGTTGLDECRQAVISGSDVIVIGQASGGTNLEFGNLSTTGVGDWDGFIGKFNASGNAQWLTTMGQFDQVAGPWALTQDASGNFYVVGEYNSSISFGGSASPLGAIFQDWDSFVVKYNSNGVALWSTPVGITSSINSANAIVLDSNNNCYVSGYLNGTVTSSSVPHTSNGAYDGIVTKISNSGNPEWNILFGGEENEFNYGIELDQFGLLHVVGTFSSDTIILDADTFSNYNPSTFDGFMTSIHRNELSCNIVNQIDYCPGSSLELSYTASGVYFPGNVFYAQLSDSNGSFDNPINLDSVASTSSGTINVTVPFSTMQADGYRLRVASTDIPQYGEDNGEDINVKDLDVVFYTIDSVLTQPPFIIDFQNYTTNAHLYDFVWYFGDGDSLVDNSFDVSHEYEFNGSYTVELIATGDSTYPCSDSELRPDHILLSGGENPTAVSEPAGLEKVTTSPNPSAGLFNIDMGKHNNTLVEYRVVDASGRSILTSNTSEDRFNVDLSGYSEGVYFLILERSGQQSIHELIKHD